MITCQNTVLAMPSLKTSVPWLVSRCPWLPVLFLVPLCIIYDTFCLLRLRCGSTGTGHEERVRRVQAQVRRWAEEGAKVPMCTARPSK